MPVKSALLSTRIQLEGQQEWSHQLELAKQSVKNLKSELSLLDSEFATSRNSVEYLTKQNKLYEGVVQQLNNQLTNLHKEQADYARQREGYVAKLKAEEEAHKSLTDRLSGQISILDDNIIKQKEYIKANEEAQKKEKARYDSLSDVLRGYRVANENAKDAIKEHETAIGKLNTQLGKAEQKQDGLKKKVDDYTDGTLARAAQNVNKYKIKIDELTETYKRHQDPHDKLHMSDERYEKTLGKLNEQLFKANEIFDKRKAKLDEHSAAYDAQTQKVDALKAAVDEHNREIDAQNKLIAENTEKANAELKPLQELEQKHYELVTSLEAMEKEQKKNKKEVTDSEDRIRALNIHLTDNEKNLQRVSTEINKTTTEINKTNSAIAKNNAYIDEATQNGREYTVLLDEEGKDTKKLREEEEKLAKQREENARAMASAELTNAYESILNLLTESSKAAREFETRLANVQKTTNMSDKDLFTFGQTLQRLSERIPIAANELADIAEKAGQLGIATRDLKDFTETMAMMGVSTDLNATEAAESLAQVASITGMTSDQYDRLASSIVALGNNFATGEKNIVLFTQRIAGAATNVKMTEDEMVAFATAISSLGIRADAGGTALQSLIGKIESAVSTGKNLEEWARVVGVSTEELVDLWQNDATTALQKFIQGLGNLDESYVTVLGNLGVGEQRLIRTVTSLANAEHETGLLTRALEMSKQAWEENNALLNEASKRYATTDSKIQIYKNSIENIKVAIGSQLNPVLGKLAEAGTSVNKFVEWSVKNLPALSATLVGVAAGIKTLNVGVSGLADAFGVAKENVSAAIEGLKNGLNVTNLVVAALVALTTALVVFAASQDTALKQTKELTKSLKAAREEMQAEVKAAKENADVITAQAATLQKLISAEQKTVYEKQAIADLVDELNKSVPNLNVAYDKEADSLINVADGTRITEEQLVKLAKAKADVIVQEEKQEALTQLYVNRTRIEQEQIRVEGELIRVQKEIADALVKDGEASDDLKNKAEELTKRYNILTGELNETDAAINEYTHGLSVASQTTEKEGVTSVNNLTDDLRKLKKEFNEASEEAQRKYKVSLMDAFDSVDKKSKLSTDKILENLMSTTKAYADSANNLKKLMDKNIDGLQDMLREMQQNGELSVEMIAALAGASNTELKNIVKNYNEAKNAATAFGEENARLETDYYNRLKAIREELIRLREEAKKKINVEITYTQTGNKYIDAGRSTPNTKNAQGLEYVPFDDYSALLHEGEMVLTKAEARAYRYEQTHGQSVTNNNRNYGGVTLNVYSREGQNIDDLADEIMYRIEDATKRKEAVWA